MPWYEYRCAVNGRTIEALHPMSATLTTWGQVCEASGEEPGDTPAGTPVEKLFSASLSIAKGSASGPDPARGGGSCGAGCRCHPG